MRKEKSIFVTEGYLLREVIPITFLKDGNRGYVMKINVLLSGTAQLTKIARSFTKRLISREEFVFSVLRPGVLTRQICGVGLQLSGLFVYVDFHGSHSFS